MAQHHANVVSDHELCEAIPINKNDMQCRGTRVLAGLFGTAIVLFVLATILSVAWPHMQKR